MLVEGVALLAALAAGFLLGCWAGRNRRSRKDIVSRALSATQPSSRRARPLHVHTTTALAA